MSDDDLGGLEGVGPKTIEKIREAATQARLEWEARDAAEEAERVAAEQALAAPAPAGQDPAADETARTEAEAPEAAPAAEGTVESPQEDATDGER
jgi:hypothetical protein